MSNPTRATGGFMGPVVSIADETGFMPEAAWELRWPEGDSPMPATFRAGYKQGFIDGHARKPEAAPSDTDIECRVCHRADGIHKMGCHPQNRIDADREALIAGLRHDAGDYAKVAQNIPMSHDLSWDQRNVRAWNAADALSRTSQPVQVEVTETASDDPEPWVHPTHGRAHMPFAGTGWRLAPRPEYNSPAAALGGEKNA